MLYAKHHDCIPYNPNFQLLNVNDCKITSHSQSSVCPSQIHICMYYIIYHADRHILNGHQVARKARCAHICRNTSTQLKCTTAAVVQLFENYLLSSRSILQVSCV